MTIRTWWMRLAWEGIAAVVAFFMLANLAVQAQTQEQGKGEAKQATTQDKVKQPATGAVDDALILLLKPNPDVRLKEHGVRTAKLELSVQQQQIQGKVAGTFAELIASRAILEKTKNWLQKLKVMRAMRAGSVSDVEIGEIEIAIIKCQRSASSKEAELISLIGKSTEKTVPTSSEEAQDLALKKNSEIRLKALGVQIAELELKIAQQKILDNIAKIELETKAIRAIYIATDKRFQKLLATREQGAKGNVSDNEVSDTELDLAQCRGDLLLKEIELAISNQSKDALQQALELSKAQGSPKQPRMANLVDVLDLALKHNPEIRLKEHAVRTAELELNVAQHQIQGKVAGTFAETFAARTIFQGAQKRFQSLKQFHDRGRPGFASEWEFWDAEIAVAKYGGDVAAKEVELTSLVGKTTKETGPIWLKEAQELALISNPEILLKAHGIRTAELELGIVQQTVLCNVALAIADTNGAREIYMIADKRLQILLKMRKGGNGIVSDMDFANAEIAALKFNGALLRKEAELAALIGKRTIDSPKIEGASLLKTSEFGGEKQVNTSILLQECCTPSAMGHLSNGGDSQAVIHGTSQADPNQPKQQDNTKNTGMTNLGELLRQQLKEPKTQDKAKNPAPGSLEEALELALKHNPDIRLKAHGVRTAELELSVAQQTIQEKILKTNAEIHLAQTISQEIKKRMDNLRRLRASKTGQVSDMEMGDAEVAVAKYSGELQIKEAELVSLSGKEPQNDPEARKGLLFPNNAEVRLKAHAIRTAELELSVMQQNVLSKVVQVFADTQATRTIYAECEKRLQRLQSLRKTGTISELEIGDAEVAVAKYKGEFLRKEAELAALTGKSVIDLPNMSGAHKFMPRDLSGKGTDALVLKAYDVGERANEIAKILQEIYSTSTGVRIFAFGKKQIIVYGSPTVHLEIATYTAHDHHPHGVVIVFPLGETGDASKIAESLSLFSKENEVGAPLIKADPKINAIIVTGTAEQVGEIRKAITALTTVPDNKLLNAEILRKELGSQLEVSFDNMTIKEVILQLQGHIKDVNFVLAKGVGAVDENQKITLKLNQKVTMAGALRFIEDQYGFRFVIREYGILCVRDATHIPAYSIPVSDFMKRGPAADAKTPAK